MTGGWSSGFEYGVKCGNAPDDGDTQSANGGVRLLVDPMSVLYLGGAEIDYREDVNGAQFVIRNPNASTTYGCGNSFGV